METNSILPVLIVSVMKDKAGKINSMENYRPISLASILSKVFERILLNRLKQYILTTDQFGFKQHCTDMYICLKNENSYKYCNQNSTVFLCFRDASMAFDYINHEITICITEESKKVIIRIVVYKSNVASVYQEEFIKVVFCLFFLFSLYMSQHLMYAIWDI